MSTAFDYRKYTKIQSESILNRISQFGNKLYLEIGGKLFDDYHASRVLPGFQPDAKIKMFSKLKDKIEFLITASADDIQSNKIRNDTGTTYESEVLRIYSQFSSFGLKDGSIVITKYNNQPNVDQFITKLQNLGYKVYKHYNIEGYPFNVTKILSEEGFGQNEYIETTKPLIMVTAPGPGSGKLATCLSQLYNDNKRGIKSGYAKFETFPIWNLPLKHPVNLAYEAATADLSDVNMIDPYHLQEYQIQAVNYNRDVEAFPVLNSIFEQIYTISPYKSPTDMGVNQIGYCIINDDLAIEASKKEIIRRYLDCVLKVKLGKYNQSVLDKMSAILNFLNLDINDRQVVSAARQKEEKAQAPAFAIELPNGDIVTGKETKLLSAPAACIINALKQLSGIRHKMLLLQPIILNPLTELKTKKFHESRSCLTINEVLIALSVSASTNPLAYEAIQKIDSLKGCDAHSTRILGYSNESSLKKLQINTTIDPIV